MNLDGDLFAPRLLLGAHLLFWPLLAHAVAGAAWRRLATPPRSHVYFGACVIILLLWQIRAVLPGGPGIHVLGATALTLIAGWRLALPGLTAALAGTTLAGAGDWAAFGLNGLLMVALPVLVSYGIARLVERLLPAHFFVYVYAMCFFGAAATVAACGLAIAAVLAAAGGDGVAADWLPAFLLIVFPEAFLTGGALTLMIVYRPQWVASFDDRRYLRR